VRMVMPYREEGGEGKDEKDGIVSKKG
jgi:hypothetical protein